MKPLIHWSAQVMALLAVTVAAQTLDRTGSIWKPIEWRLECPPPSGNPFDVQASAKFTHSSGETRKTLLFYDGDGGWRFRFTATQPGEWRFVTESGVEALNGKSGSVKIEKGEDGARGFIVPTDEHKWGWQVGNSGQVIPFVPQLVMGRDLEAYRDPAKIDSDVQRWLVEHGFSGVHVAVLCRWFDFENVSSSNIETIDPNPDPRTFEVLDALITRFHQAGGMVHLWQWGDESRGMTPAKWGINGQADKRLQRYIAARLGPLPGWTMGYGFDLWEWVDGPALAQWHSTLHEHFGWPHLLGARWEKNQLTQPTEVLDYSSYEQHQPTYEDYVATLEKRASKPSFSEDRFRVRDPSPYPEKDYTLDQTRRGLWNSAMAGGVANIWGYLVPEAEEGGSRSYPNHEQIATYARFFKDRFVPGLRRVPAAKARALASKEKGLTLLYGENATTIVFDNFRFSGTVSAVAVDARKAYAELPVSAKSIKAGEWKAPYQSDWALALTGEFQLVE